MPAGSASSPPQWTWPNAPRNGAPHRNTCSPRPDDRPRPPRPDPAATGCRAARWMRKKASMSICMIQRCEGDTLILPKRPRPSMTISLQKAPFRGLSLTRGGALSKEEVPVVICPCCALKRATYRGVAAPLFPSHKESGSLPERNLCRSGPWRIPLICTASATGVPDISTSPKRARWSSARSAAKAARKSAFWKSSASSRNAGTTCPCCCASKTFWTPRYPFFIRLSAPPSASSATRATTAACFPSR